MPIAPTTLMTSRLANWIVGLLGVSSRAMLGLLSTAADFLATEMQTRVTWATSCVEDTFLE